MDIKSYLKQSSVYNLLVVNSVIRERSRNKILSLSKNTIYVTFFILILFYLVKDTERFVAFSKVATFVAPRLIGLFLLNIGVYLFAKLLDYYFSSQYYFEHIVNNKYSKDEIYTLSAGKILYEGRKTDILHGLCYSRTGMFLFLRLGISEKEVLSFISSQVPEKEETMPKAKSDILTLQDIVSYLYTNNTAFSKFLLDRGVTDKELFGALDWIIYDIEKREYKKQWWRPESLALIKGIAKDWSFGKTFLLDKYSRDLMMDEQVSSDLFVISDREVEIGQIETSLSKSNESNVVLVGEAGQEKIQVIWSMCRHIRDGNISTALIGKRPVLLMINTMVSFCSSKEILEDQLTRILDEVVLAGNVVLVIDNFSLLLSTAVMLGVDITSLIDPYLASPNIQIIAISDVGEYYKYIEPNKGLMSRFETVMVKPLNAEENARIIADSALNIEKEYGVFFTYQAVRELADSAEYYFPDGLSSDKAMDLLNEIAPWARRQSISYINKDAVLDYIEQKTNIPASGKITTVEKDKLLNLESLLADRVVGQRDAIVAVSNAMRRSRSGIRNPNRPIGSFLFLGPTGVGKTETSKALAQVFFGNEENMMRLDMSEYQTDDSMSRLIGSFESEKPGVFSSMIREKQFGVVLLDEFEKTNKEVLNLFLQILDEGFFSDVMGKRVSAKNIIFIATSNAGADTIFNMVNAGKNPRDAKEEIIQDIINRGLFKPELINRFDGTIIFEPLNDEDLKQIARLMLKKLSSRLAEKGVALKVTDDVISYIIKNGSNKAFGARPMNRFIQDTVEEKIAELLIQKQIHAGNSVEFQISEAGLSPIIK
jgi:ATP-dependent Clp protease ATP-binding subunit ClpC